MAAKRTTYKLLKYGDPFLTKVCQPIVFPLTDDVDKILDECQNTLVIIKKLTLYSATWKVSGINDRFPVRPPK
jgi:hypothetical protein